MALSSAFKERLEHMEHTRNQRLSLLQAEKELQTNKSQVLVAKLENIRSIEQRCLLLDRKIASNNFKISALNSEIQSFEAKYKEDSQQFMVLKSEVEELEEVEKEKERFYEMNDFQMKEFRENVEKFTLGLRNRVIQLKSTLMQLQGNNGSFSNADLAAAEIRKSELLAVKENLDRSLASNYQIRAQLQKQVQNISITQNQDRKKLSQFTENKVVK